MVLIGFCMLTKKGVTTPAVNQAAPIVFKNSDKLLSYALFRFFTARLYQESKDLARFYIGYRIGFLRITQDKL